MVNHVNDKKWNSVEHYWVRNGVCTADKDYKVRGVPHCLLVDLNGVIVWMGHPLTRNLEEDLTNLLAGKVLEVKPEDDEYDDEEPEEEKKEDEKNIDMDVAKVAVDTFIADTKALLEGSEFKESASKLMRAFLVLVNDTTCDLAKAGELRTAMHCHTSLVGPEKAFEKTQTACMAISHQEGAIWRNLEHMRKMKEFVIGL